MTPFQLPRWKLSSCCGHEFGYGSPHEGARGAPGRPGVGGRTRCGSAGGGNAGGVGGVWRMRGGYGRVACCPTCGATDHEPRRKEAPAGLEVVGDGGKVLPAVREVLKE